MKHKILSFLLLGLVCSIGNAWADTTYSLIDRSGATPTINSTDFKGAVASSYLKTDNGDKTFDETTTLSSHVTLGGTNSSTSGLYEAKKFIAYDAKTTSTKFKVYVYNSNSSAQNLYYSYIVEGENSEPSSGRKVTKSIASKAANPESFEFTVNGEKNKTVVFYVGNTNIVFYQIEAIESGTTLPVGGERGYSVNLNKGRLAAASATASLLEGIEYSTSSNYGFINKTAVEIQTKGTHYIQFTTTQTTKTTVTVSSSKTYYIATAKNPAEIDIVATNTATSNTTLPAGTYYIVPNGDKVSVTNLAFAIPDAPSAIEFSPAGGSVSAEEDITLTSAGSDVIKYQWSSAAIDGEGDWSGAETYADDNKPSTPSVGDANNVLSVWASNDGGNTYGSATYTVVANEAPSKPAITGAPGSAVAKGTSVTLTAASATGTPAPTYVWYQCDDAEKTNPISKATTAEYSPSTATAGTFYFYAVATNSEGSVASDVVTLTVNPSNACKLTEAKYSNGFNAFIDESAKTVTVYYLEGESAPTVSSTTISTDATPNTSDASQIVITAEDGTTSATYAVTRTPVTPYAGTGSYTFDGTETWVKTGGAYQITTGSGSSTKTYYAWVINKLNDNSDNRISLGKTRIYFFIASSQSVTLINDRGTSLSSNRKINVYVNGEKQASPTEMPKYAASPSASITITTGGVAMIEISANQENGDTGWGSISIIPTSVGADFAADWATFASPYSLDLSTISGGAAYVATTVADGAVTLVSTDAVVPAGTGLMIKKSGDATSFSISTSSEAGSAPATNLLVGVTGSDKSITSSDNAYVLALQNDELGFYKMTTGTVPAGKAYLSYDGSLAPSVIRIVDGEDNATSISNLEGFDGTVKFIENGQLFILKNGITYDLLGRIVK